MGLHIVGLVARGVAAQQDVLGHVGGIAPVDEESVLHVACGMVGGKVEHREDVLVIVDLGTAIEREAHTGEYVDNLVFHQRQRMARTQRHGIGRARQVDIVALRRLVLHLLLECVDAARASCLSSLILMPTARFGRRPRCGTRP